MTGETFMRQHTSNANVLDMCNAAMRAILGCDARQTSALYMVAYAASAGSFMKLCLAEEGTGQELNVVGGTQQVHRHVN